MPLLEKLAALWRVAQPLVEAAEQAEVQVDRILSDSEVQQVIADNVPVTVTPYQNGEPMLRYMVTARGDNLRETVRAALEIPQADAIHFCSQHGLIVYTLT